MAHEKTSLTHWIVLLACEQAREHQKANQVATLGDFPGVDSVKMMERLYAASLILRRYNTTGSKDVIRRHLRDLAVSGRLIQAQTFDRTQPTRYVPTPYAEKLYGQLENDGLIPYALSRDGRKNLTELFLWASYHAKLSERTRSVDDLVRDCALPGVDRLQASLDRLKRGIRVPLSSEEGGPKTLRLSSREVSPGLIQLWTREGEPPVRPTQTEGVDFALPSKENDGLISAAEKLVPGPVLKLPDPPADMPVDNWIFHVDDLEDEPEDEPEDEAPPMREADLTTPAESLDPTDPEPKYERKFEADETPVQMDRGVFDLDEVPVEVYQFLRNSARRHGHSVQDEIRHVLAGHRRRSLARGQLRQAIAELIMEELS